MKFCRKCGKEYADGFEACPADGTALTANRADPPTGTSFAGRYQMLEKIGEGGMGTVYKAVHTRMYRICAIKLLSADRAEGQSAVERFNREAQMASRIDNPHAVVIYDFGETEDGILYLVMEYVDGESLGRVLLREKTFTPERACRVACQIADALGAAHALGIVHRDLKPDNVMLTSRPGAADYVKVLDFGIAKTVSHDGGEDLTQTGFVLGTPAYMSPEQLSGDKLDARSDIYSLALIVYQMISGKLPFEGETTQARLIKRVVDSPVQLRSYSPSISAGLEAAVMAGLARNREDRPASAALFANSLVACFDAGASIGLTRLTLPVSSPSKSPVATGGSTAPQAGETAAQAGATEADYLPTVPIDVAITSPTEAETHGYGPPSSYITRQSTTPMVSESSGGAPYRHGQQPGFESVHPVGRRPDSAHRGRQEHGSPNVLDPGIHATRVDQQSQSPSAPAGRFDRRSEFAEASKSEEPGVAVPETIAAPRVVHAAPATRVNPRQGPGLISPTNAQPVPAAGTRKGTAIGVLVAAVGFLLILVIGGAIFVYMKYLRAPAIDQPRVSVGPVAPLGPTASGTVATAPSTDGRITAGTPLTVAPSSAEAAAHFAEGKSHQEQGRLLAQGGSAESAREEDGKAIAEYNEAIKLQPMFPEAHENLGVALYDSGRVDDAAEQYRIAIDQYTAQRNAPTAQVMVNYGLALFDSKRYRDSAEAFGRALQLDPADHDIYVHRGFALQNAGDYESAKSDYRRYLALEPSGQYADGVKQILAGRARPPSQSGNR